MDPLIHPRVYGQLRWHARRGLLELDIILGRFLNAQLPLLSKDDILLLENILLLADNDLLDLLMGRTFSANPRWQNMIDRMRNIEMKSDLTPI